MAEKTIEIENFEQFVGLFGSFDENIKLIESGYDVKVVSRGSELKLLGEEGNVQKALKAIDGLLLLMKKGQTLDSFAYEKGANARRAKCKVCYDTCG